MKKFFIVLSFVFLIMSSVVLSACDKNGGEKLDGYLSLESVIVTATSIVSDTNDFDYENHLKISALNIKLGDNQANILSDFLLAKKNVKQTLTVTDDFSVATCTDFSISYSVDANYMYNSTEFNFDENNMQNLTVRQDQTTDNLVNNQITYTASNNNSSNNKFSYSISFVFNYHANI